MVRQEYEMVRQLQQEQQSLSHDLKNHLLVMDTMLKEGKYQEARNYIGQLGIPLERLAPSIWTGTSTLDVLLNHTRNRCIQSHIIFTVQADAVDLRPMEDQDICRGDSNPVQYHIGCGVPGIWNPEGVYRDISGGCHDFYYRRRA